MTEQAKVLRDKKFIAKKVSMAVWKYLKDNIRINRKGGLSCEFIDLILDDINFCPLCDLYMNDLGCNTQCPLSKMGCLSNDSPWRIWNSSFHPVEQRQEAADWIYNTIAEWDINK